MVPGDYTRKAGARQAGGVGGGGLYHATMPVCPIGWVCLGDGRRRTNGECRRGQPNPGEGMIYQATFHRDGEIGAVIAFQAVLDISAGNG